ncbi:MAG: hypothetical protein ABJC26_10845 [Gemmatimonadaceae bacterium]
MSMLRLRLLDTLSVLGLIAAAFIAVMPANIQPSSSAPRAKIAMAMPVGPGFTQDVDAGVVLAANILSGSRREPKMHYRSPDAEIMQAFAPQAVDVKSDTTASGGSGNAEVIPSLYGIVNNGGTWQALLRLSADDVNPTLLKEGDRRGAYRVVSILPDRVIVAGTSGQRTLRLARTAPSDSTGSTRKRP